MKNIAPNPHTFEFMDRQLCFSCSYWRVDYLRSPFTIRIVTFANFINLRVNYSVIYESW